MCSYTMVFPSFPPRVACGASPGGCRTKAPIMTDVLLEYVCFGLYGLGCMVWAVSWNLWISVQDGDEGCSSSSISNSGGQLKV